MGASISSRNEGRGPRSSSIYRRRESISPSNAQSIRLLLVDDHEVVRLGLRTLFQRTNSIEVVGEAGNASEAGNEALRLKPDIVLRDVRLPDSRGIDACRTIRATCPETRVLFLTSYPDDDTVLATILAGGHGYLVKEVGGKALIDAIENVHKGNSILDPAVTKHVLERMQVLSAEGDSKEDELSRQQRRVLNLVTQGKTNKEIAAELGLSDKTVKNYLSNVYQKLQVNRRSQAAGVFARRIQQ